MMVFGGTVAMAHPHPTVTLTPNHDSFNLDDGGCGCVSSSLRRLAPERNDPSVDIWRMDRSSIKPIFSPVSVRELPFAHHCASQLYRKATWDSE
jgi:hypothetical protein